MEIDGESHIDQIDYDAESTKYLNNLGYRVLRFTNRDVVNNLDGVIETILAACSDI